MSSFTNAENDNKRRIIATASALIRAKQFNSFENLLLVNEITLSQFAAECEELMVPIPSANYFTEYIAHTLNTHHGLIMRDLIKQIALDFIKHHKTGRIENL